MTITDTQPADSHGGLKAANSHDSEATTHRVITRLATWKVWLVTTTAFTAFAVAFFASSAPFSIPHVENECGQAPPDMRFTSSAADVESFLTTCGEAGRVAYGNMLLADLFYPAVVGLFMASSLAMVLSRLAPGGRIVSLAWLPMLGAGFDYLENVFAWRALAAFPQPAATTALLGVASAAKTTTFWLAGLLLLGSIGVLIARKFGGRDRPTAS
jgi:hypothetical protein